LDKRVGTFLQILFGFAVLGGTGWGLFLLARSASQAFTQLDEKTAASLVAAFTTIVVSLVSVLVAKSYERRRAIEIELRGKKTPFYENLIALVFDAIYSAKFGESMSEKETHKAFADATKNLVIWGSPEVVSAFSRFRRLATTASASKDPPSVMITVEGLLRAIRKDLGHDDSKVQKGDILRLFINDIDQHL